MNRKLLEQSLAALQFHTWETRPLVETENFMAVLEAEIAKLPEACTDFKETTHTLNSTQTVAVAIDTYWVPIDASTPRNVKVQLLTIGGIAQYGSLGQDTSFYTHWCPVPKKPKPQNTDTVQLY